MKNNSLSKKMNIIGVILLIPGFIMVYFYDNYTYSLFLVGAGSALMLPDNIHYAKERIRNNPRMEVYYYAKLIFIFFVTLVCNLAILILLIQRISGQL